jgi:hypothetical protein
MRIREGEVEGREGEGGRREKEGEGGRRREKEGEERQGGMTSFSPRKINRRQRKEV